MNIERRDISFEDAPEAELVVEERAGGKTVITGYAAVYDRLSLELPGNFRERIMPGAFDKVLARQRGKQDVVAVFNHDNNIVLGRTSSGTLELSSDAKGLRYEVTPPATRSDIVELIARRDVRGSSFAFTVGTGGDAWSSDDKGSIRSVREVSGLFDVGPVVNPAYPDSSVQAALRSYEAWMETQNVKEIVKAPIASVRSWIIEASEAWARRLNDMKNG
jgi:HK97 family phage prohead protease